MSDASRYLSLPSWPQDFQLYDDLLERCITPKGRKELAEATGISSKLILKWANHADLFRINGIGPQFAELLEAAGNTTLPIDKAHL